MLISGMIGKRMIHDGMLVLGGIAVAAAYYLVTESPGEAESKRGVSPVQSPTEAVRKSGRPSVAAPVPIRTAGDLPKILQSGEDLDRMRQFVDWLAGVDARNWKARWEIFAETIKGQEGEYGGELHLFLSHLGKVAGDGAAAYFAALEKDTNPPAKTKVVLTAWAETDPEAAADFFGPLSAGIGHLLVPSLIEGIARHGIDSLIQMSLDPRYAQFDFPVSWPVEMMTALRQFGGIQDGESLWRRHQEMNGRQDPAQGHISHPQLFEALVKWKTETAGTAGDAANVCRWLMGVYEEGYTGDGRWWSNAGRAATAYAKLDPPSAFAWVREFALKAGAVTDQERSMANQIGLMPAQEWARRDPASLSLWLANHSEDSGYEAGAAALYSVMKDSDPETAASWGNTVKFEWLRRAVGLPLENR